MAAEQPLGAYKGDGPYLFVSYAHDDADLAYPEMRWLQDAGFDLWYDDGIHVGSVWRQALADALSGSAGMLFIATEHSVTSSNCMKELNFILDEEKPVFVVQLDETPLPGLLKLSLSDRQMLSKGDLDEASYRRRLTEALETVVPPRRAAAGAAEAVRVSVPTRVPLVALQPLVTSSDDQQFWAEGLVDDLATLLGRRGLRIVNTPDTVRDAAEIGRRLDADYVVSGTVRSGAEGRIRLGLRVSDGRTGAQIWSERFDDEGDLLDVADRLTRRSGVGISEAIFIDQRRRARQADVDSLDAWGLCMRASGRTINSAADRDAVQSLLRRAVDRDPAFALAHAALGSALSFHVITQFSRNPDADIAEALDSVERALSLDPTNPVIMQLAAGTHRCFGNEGLGMDLARRAHEAGESDALLQGGGLPYFSCLVQAGELDEAIRIGLESSQPPGRILSLAYLLKGDLERALEWAQRHAANTAYLYLSWVELANVLGQLDRLDEARDALERATHMVPTFTLDLYEKGIRITWRNHAEIIAPLMAGLRRLEA